MSQVATLRHARAALVGALRTTTLAATLATALAGCAESTAPDAGSKPDGGTGGGAAYVVSGRVTDASGAPIAGAEVVADNQLLYNSNVVGVTGSDGRYRLTLPPIAATWAMSASIRRTFDGTAYHIDLAGDGTPFAGNAGAVRDFVWRLQGARPDGGFYGSPVIAYAALGDVDLVMADVELTLTPVGTLIDGSAGRPITQRLRATGDGDAVVDVPLGRYTIAARELRTGAAPRALQIRPRNGGAYAATLTTSFAAPYGTNLAIQQIVVEVRR